MGVFPPFSVEISGLASPQAQTRPPALGRGHGEAGTKAWPLRERGPSCSPSSPQQAGDQGAAPRSPGWPTMARGHGGVVEGGYRGPLLPCHDKATADRSR